jgi:nitroreductase
MIALLWIFVGEFMLIGDNAVGFESCPKAGFDIMTIYHLWYTVAKLVCLLNRL